MSADEEPRGTVASHPWPTTLAAHVASAGPPARVHGYDLRRDLAVHYDFGEYLVLALTGRPPSAALGKAANIALIALADATVADASVHAATLARRCGADEKSTLATGLVALAEEAAHLLQTAQTSPPQGDAVVAFFATLPGEIQHALGEPRRTIAQTALAVLRLAGLDDPLQLQAALALARAPVMVAEALAVERGDVRDYPMQLPTFVYGEESDA